MFFQVNDKFKNNLVLYKYSIICLSKIFKIKFYETYFETIRTRSKIIQSTHSD